MLKELARQDNLVKYDVDFTEAWRKYREEVKHISRRNKINSNAEYNKIVKECLKSIAYFWTNSTGGVYVKNMGYFTLFRPPKKLVHKNIYKEKAYLNTFLLTHGYTYLLTHITNLKLSDSFSGFKIRRTYKPLRSSTKNNIINGRRYTINSIILKEYLKKRTFI